MTEVKRYQKVAGDEREKLRALVKEAYEKEKGTIRSVVEEMGLSYGFVRTLLLEAEVPLKKTWTTRRRSAV